MKPLGFLLNSILILIPLRTLPAQVPNPTQQQATYTVVRAPVFRVTVVSRTIKAVNYHHRAGSTYIGFRGTDLMPAATGEARVNSQPGSTKIETSLHQMSPANQYGPEYLTYVLWAITPEGRPVNLGELALTGDHAKLLSTTDLQSFGLMVTAEPYFAVTQPSNVVVAENFIRSDTTGTIEEVDTKYDLLQRGQYVVNRPGYKPVKINPKGPLQLAEAENAVEIARLAGAEQYAGDTFQKAVIDLRNAEDSLGRGHHRESETSAREAAQMAEDARIITFKGIQEDQRAAERAAAAQREAQARAQAQQAAEQARQEQERREQAEADRAAAERAKLEAQRSAQQAAEAQAQANAARAQALQERQAEQAEADRVRQEKEQSEQLRQQAEAEKNQLRERLRRQLNVILETRETARGLIVNLSDVLFETGSYALRPGAREKMAKLSGVLLAYPGLKIEVDGHTDNVGGDEYNQRLSEERAEAVRDYLVAQGVSRSSVNAIGFGKTHAVASNDTASGRQQNRRVEIVVSGEPIGVAPSGVR